MASDKRFLRSPELRAALYLEAGGKCQICGGQLGDDWHADHIIPWAVSHRTNIFEMQALCADCNLRKGDRMTNNGLEGFNPSRLRPGQQEAIETIIQRVAAKQEHTSIVLPTRYGKSDVIRVTGAMLLRNEVVGRCLILEPATFLVNQIASTDGMERAIETYGLPFLPKDLPVYPMTDKFNFRDLMGDVPFLAMTIQMATKNTRNGILQQLIDHDIVKRRRPPIVFIDEAHTGSKGNHWGECTEALSRAGAFLVLLTATPYRTDEAHVYGFEYKQVDLEDITLYRNAEDEKLDVYEGQRVAYRLDADFEYTFRDAWNEEPLPICHVSCRSFDVSMDKIEGETKELLGQSMLSELTKAGGKKWLGRVVRNPIVIETGVATFMDELLTLRKSANKAQGIVFVGQDLDPDSATNEQALRVQAAIENLNPDMKVDIATTSTGPAGEAAQKMISAFAQGEGADVLIVKQMGGIGLDAPALKVCLDLSPVRTETQFIQRMMRIATIWEPPEGQEVLIAHYVTPDDLRGRQLFRSLVYKQGGDAATVDVEYVRTIFKENKPPPPPEPIYVPVGGREGRALDDTEGRQALSDSLPWIKYAKNKVKRLTYVLTDPQIAELQTLAQDYENGTAPASEGPSDKTDGVQNIPMAKKDLRDAINDTIREITRLQHPNASKDMLVGFFRENHTKLKLERCGLPYMKLEEYVLDELKYLKEEAERWRSEL